MTLRGASGDGRRAPERAVKTAGSHQPPPARHVKCDEARPACRKCVVGGRSCRYAHPPRAEYRQLAPKKKTTTTTETTAALAPLRQSEPPHWDLMQAVRYYLTVIRPALAVEFGPQNAIRLDGLWRISDIFISKVLGSQIIESCKSRDRLLHPGEDPAFRGVWATYLRYMLATLTATNALVGVRWRPGARHPFYQLLSLLFLDFQVPGNLWRLHMKGFLAYVDQCFGGIAFVADRPVPTVDFTLILIRVITANTTSPARQQVLGYDHYTDDQLRKVLKFDTSTDIPCPIELIVIIVLVTRLRVRAAAAADAPAHGTTTTSSLQLAVGDIFRRIDEFDLDAWLEEKQFAEMAIAPAVGEIFYLAVRLYAILTLPGEAVLVAHPDGQESTEELRFLYRRKLSDRLRETIPQVVYYPGLRWPIIVAGVAAGADDGDALWDRQFVEEQMYRMWKHPLTNTTVFVGLQKLRSFWESGGTDWEECFDEPCAF
ncbi:C6 zinc finger domain-containing protein [Cordyceps javanica]|uniref:C6 zinc finger domain-containing protein n=1 Tax=Cordyceps javanica TaxID=43265 RepID=A0A545VRZ9_9HYPO|nr:C6 zinc finger domain-containing protein [Cordyceps javanica]TQW04503.1 C6 zinc finger domain protein [Cordyceps javanica]